MGLSSELARALPRVPHPVKKCALELEAEKAALRFGGVPQDPSPPVDRLARIEAMLESSGGVDRAFGPGELMVIPYLIWGDSLRWRTSEFVRDYMSAVEERWPTGLRRLWRHFALNYDPACPATIEMAAWFRRRSLPELLSSFSETYRLLDVESAADELAKAALQGDQLIEDLQSIGLSTAVVRSSALCMTTLSAAGRLFPSLPGTSRIIDRVKALLDAAPENAIAQAVCTETVRSNALRSLIDGVIRWQESHDTKGEHFGATLDFLLALNGDPRFVPERWRGHVSDRSIATIERWLSRETIESFFRVIDALRTERDDMWQARRLFWLSYLPHVSKAWLIVGQGAAALAEREGLRFGRFVSGGGAKYNHCGLMLQLADICVLEMNMNGSAVFWAAGTGGLPGLYEETYVRSRYIHPVAGGDHVVIAHHDGWQRKFRDQILSMTGILVL